ncbi:MAG: ABC transporter ATP-binding protein/permease [Treponema sp.]|jgi:ATP-binding cassette subfamily B protein|nr:ABC transporter ATP-binding protein/permease [Treponema sp.]
MSKQKAIAGKEQDGKEYGVFTLLGKLAPPVFRAAPISFILINMMGILHGASWGVDVTARQRFFDSAAALVGGAGGTAPVFAALGLLGLVALLCQVLNGAHNLFYMPLSDKIIGALTVTMQEKAARIAPIQFEDTRRLDDINKASQGKDNVVDFAMTFINIFTFYVPYFVYMSLYLMSLKPLLAISIAIVFVPTALTQIIRVRAFTDVEKGAAPARREYEYYETCIAGREYFKETRLLGGFRFFSKLYIDAFRVMRDLILKARLKSDMFELGARALTCGGYFCILFLLFRSLMAAEISVGAFAAVASAIGMLYNIMEEVVCMHIGRIAQNMGAIRNYVRFMEMEERGGVNREPEADCDISLEGVSFTYPGAESPAVKDVSLRIKNSETLAIVGENGSGKSTLVRLITGIYTPAEGAVRYGRDRTEDLSLSSLCGCTSGVFQKYQKYQMTLEENLIISRADADWAVADRRRLDEICEQAGVERESAAFPQGYDTMLSREFDGVDLSGGQWQRVAIGRGFFREHSLIVLDEPTAAIDPYEETRIYQRFAEISKGKTAIIVTHRLGSVRLADRIVVMKEGRLVESGTHEELVAAGGEYAQLYASQEQWYK